MWNRPENQVTLALVRHGQTQANQERRYLGKTDEALSDSGKKELQLYQAQNCYPKINYVFASPMKRCLETARILFPALCPVVVDEWEEMDFGEFEYKNYEELKDDARYQEWLRNGGTGTFPKGESREDFIKRCEIGLLKMCGILQEMEGQNRKGPHAKESVRAGIVVHGGTIMALLHSFCRKEYFDCQVSNGRGYLCELGWDGKAVTNKNQIQMKVVNKI